MQSNKKERRVDDRRNKRYGLEVLYTFWDIKNPACASVNDSPSFGYRLQELLKSDFKDIVSGVGTVDVDYHGWDHKTFGISVTIFLSSERPSSIPTSYPWDIEDFQKILEQGYMTVQKALLKERGAKKVEEATIRALHFVFQEVERRARVTVDYAARKKALQEEVSANIKLQAQDPALLEEVRVMLESSTDSTPFLARERILRELVAYLLYREPSFDPFSAAYGDQKAYKAFKESLP